MPGQPKQLNTTYWRRNTFDRWTQFTGHFNLASNDLSLLQKSWCFARSYFLLNSLLHNSQPNFLLSWIDSTCLLRWSFWWNIISHSPHEYSLFPWYFQMWTLKFFGVWNSLPHRPHKRFHFLNVYKNGQSNREYLQRTHHKSGTNSLTFQQWLNAWKEKQCLRNVSLPDRNLSCI